MPAPGPRLSLRPHDTGVTASCVCVHCPLAPAPLTSRLGLSRGLRPAPRRLRDELIMCLISPCLELLPGLLPSLSEPRTLSTAGGRVTAAPAGHGHTRSCLCRGRGDAASAICPSPSVGTVCPAPGPGVRRLHGGRWAGPSVGHERSGLGAGRASSPATVCGRGSGRPRLVCRGRRGWIRRIWGQRLRASLSGQARTTGPFFVLRSRPTAGVPAADWEPVLQRPGCPWGSGPGLSSVAAQTPAPAPSAWFWTRAQWRQASIST